jgi:hypothetical protein
VGPSPALSEEFVSTCKKIPGFASSSKRAAIGGAGRFYLGEEGAIRLGAGLTVTLVSVPPVVEIMPLLKSFSSSLAGLIVLCDNDASGNLLKAILGLKRGVSAIKPVPAVYVFTPEPDDAARRSQLKRALSIGPDEEPFILNGKDARTGALALRALFKHILSQENQPATLKH